MCDSQGADWTAIVQAGSALVGICIAVGVPWWQRHKEVQDRKADDLTRAHVVASSVQLMMNPMIGAIEATIDEIDRPNPWDRDWIQKVHSRFGDHGLPNEGQCLALVAAGRPIALSASRGARLINQFQSAIWALVQRTDGETVLHEMHLLKPLLVLAKAEFEKVREQLGAFVDEQEGPDASIV